MTRTVDVSEAGMQIPELVAMAEAGTEVILTQGDVPLARLVPIRTETKPRLAGLNAGALQPTEDFDAPLPDSFWLGAA